MGRKGITAKQYGSPMQILGVVEPKISLPIMVAQSVGGTDKIVKAGTPVFGDLTARNTAFTAATAATSTTDAKVTGVVLHDVDVTDGAAEAALLIFGVVNVDRLDASVVTLLNANGIKDALHGIYFIKD